MAWGEIWERYKQGLPASITEGPQDLGELLMQRRKSESERGGPLFLGAIDTMAALAGEPRPSREGMEQEGGTWDTSLRVLGDVSAAAQGKPGPTMLGRDVLEEPGVWEKIVSPLADVSSILQRGNLASRQAGLKRAQIALEEREQDFRLMNGWLDMNKKIRDYARGLPAEEQADVFEKSAQLMDEDLFPGAGELLRIEKRASGTIPDDMNQLFRWLPHLETTYRVGGREALQEVLTQPGLQDELREAADAEALGPMTRWWNELAEPHLQQHEPEVWKKVMEDGIVDIDEFKRFWFLIPETMRPEEPYGSDWVVRNSDKVPFIKESFADDVRKAEALAEVTRETERQREAGKLGAQYILRRASGAALRVTRKGSGYVDQFGQRVVVGPEDKLEVVTGKAERPSKTIVAAQEALRENIDVLSTLSRIEGSFDPYFLTVRGKAKLSALRNADKLGVGLSEENRDLLRAGTEFLQNAFENMNAVIKAITGAQMSELEARRIRKQLPDPEKDSPEEFATKLQNTLAYVRLSVARSVIQQSGTFTESFSETASLADTKSLLLATARSEFNKLVDQGVDELEAHAKVRSIMLEQFGIDPASLVDLEDSGIQ